MLRNEFHGEILESPVFVIDEAVEHFAGQVVGLDHAQDLDQVGCWNVVPFVAKFFSHEPFRFLLNTD